MRIAVVAFIETHPPVKIINKLPSEYDLEFTAYATGIRQVRNRRQRRRQFQLRQIVTIPIPVQRRKRLNSVFAFKAARDVFPTHLQVWRLSGISRGAGRYRSDEQGLLTPG